VPNGGVDQCCRWQPRSVWIVDTRPPPARQHDNNMSPAEVLLRTLLLHGPSPSREVLASMAARHFSPKQVRNARERLGVVALRSGNGADMRSTWRLPAGASSVAPGALDATCTNDAPAPHRYAACRTADQKRRHQARVEAFTGRSMDASTARQVANALVARDSDGLRAFGSCAECQCVELRICPTRPKPVTEIHQCWFRRQCTP
jgi:hypothetical protein